MSYVNNYIQPVVLDELDDSLALDLSDGIYRLTLADSDTAPTRWEIVQAAVAGGAAALTRGLEGTARQSWPAGSVIYSGITAGTLQGIEDRLTALEEGGGGGGGPGPWITLEPYPGSGWATDEFLAPYPPAARTNGDMLELCGSMFAENATSGGYLFELPPELRAVSSSDPGKSIDLMLPVIVSYPFGGDTAPMFPKLSGGLPWLGAVDEGAVVSLDGLRVRRIWP